MRDAVRAEGYSCETVSGETPRRERDRIVAAFRAGQIRCLTSVGVLGTGFNVPRSIWSALLRRPAAPRLYVQQVGRGAPLRARQGRRADPRLCRSGADARARGRRDGPERHPGIGRGRGLARQALPRPAAP
ncbi:helicase-related protein [Methylobacterium oryzae CBMB20]